MYARGAVPKALLQLCEQRGLESPHLVYKDAKRPRQVSLARNLTGRFCLRQLASHLAEKRFFVGRALTSAPLTTRPADPLPSREIPRGTDMLFRFAAGRTRALLTAPCCSFWLSSLALARSITRARFKAFARRADERRLATSVPPLLSERSTWARPRRPIWPTTSKYADP